MLTLPFTPIRPGDRICCAISGGADSTALLLLLHAANTQPRNALGIGLAAIHINHSLASCRIRRGSSLRRSPLHPPRHPAHYPHR